MTQVLLLYHVPVKNYDWNKWYSCFNI